MAKPDKEIHLSAGKLAAAWGAKPAAVKKLLAAHAVEPDLVHCGCKYYDVRKLDALKAELA